MKIILTIVKTIKPAKEDTYIREVLTEEKVIENVRDFKFNDVDHTLEVKYNNNREEIIWLTQKLGDDIHQWILLDFKVFLIPLKIV